MNGRKRQWLMIDREGYLSVCVSMGGVLHRDSKLKGRSNGGGAEEGERSRKRATIYLRTPRSLFLYGSFAASASAFSPLPRSILVFDLGLDRFRTLGTTSRSILLVKPCSSVSQGFTPFSRGRFTTPITDTLLEQRRKMFCQHVRDYLSKDSAARAVSVSLRSASAE